MTTAFERRTERAQAALREAGADGLVVFPGPNLYYLSGVAEEPSERHTLLIVPAADDPTFLVPTMSASRIREATWVEDVRPWGDGDDPVARLASIVDDLGLGEGEVLVDDHLWAIFYQDLRSILPDAEFGLASEVLSPLRVRKDDREIHALREAGEIADSAIRGLHALGEAVVGMTEAELSRKIESLMRDRGGGDPSFEIIAASGPNGAKPHHGHGDREIERGDPVVLDFGCRFDHYPSDQTRTLVFGGDPPNGFADVHEAVVDALHAGVEAAGPNVPAEDVDRAARAVIEDAGYGDRFIHRTGHGVGLDVHEPPYIVEGNDRPLEPGMVFSVEPGVYIEGEFGVRVEDLVLVTVDGVERLNDSARGWRV